MAYGRFGGGGQSNLRAPDAGQERANKKDQERNVTIPKVKLPVKKKKKPVTIFGFKVTAPKTDMQKKIDSGQATVLAGRKLDSGKTLLTTEKATGKIVSKNEQDRKILTGSSKTMQGRDFGMTPTNKFQNAGKNFTDFPLEAKPKSTARPSGLNVAGAYKAGKGLYKGPTQTAKADQSLLTKNLKKATPAFNSSYKTSVEPAIKKTLDTKIKTLTNKATLLRGKITKSAGQFNTLTERTFLKDATKKGIGKALSGGSTGSTTVSTKVSNKVTPVFNKVQKQLPSNYTVSSQKKSKPIPVDAVSNLKVANTGVTSKIAGSNILAQNIAKSDAKMNQSTYAKEGPEVPVFNVKANKVPASLIRQLRLSNTAELNAYMVPNVLSTYSKAEQKAIKAEFRKRQGNKNKTKSLLTRLAVGAVM